MAPRSPAKRVNKRDTKDKRPMKKKVSILNTERITYVDYKDVNLLRRFVSERAKIRARRVTGNDTQQQREIARAIRVAREMGLLPYSIRQVTQRKGGRRGRDERRDDDRPMPTPTEAPPTGAGYVAEAVGEGAEFDTDTTVEVSEEAAE